ncbi:serine/threonine-protein kinase 33-like [Acanthaster planci]|uniref:Serine/threonine-protein kinase 33-like n=1 Tax=Acanthaster planci TaxID=133434 RepID=A0A8B8A333_ACAPL|nr:serine/threonine-protein kinase 33-like [Acanthaster planci]XP_022112094.1 serine/threonine-protein kinase 33-like [Acanthaster planci]XP_022112096.1 serine/threonine-protein kinase 33-like [Acanthaster planci]XP_022112097.1 serine/threonine-protein kinase 33-like [Acanthaster planci]XP_022112098.1 serine/threonine-protein kinase 33-like [Acanthaster planci]XP_022112099.1 serine/threonine-protein kinase 33-like [Acanthaster planci]
MSRNSQEKPSRTVRHTRIDDESVIEKVYTFGEKLGAGSFGVVLEATHNESKERWAIKIVNKEKAGSSAVKLLEREVAILKKVRHKHIIHLEAVYETSQKMYLVLELCNGGELSDLFKEKGAFTEEDTRTAIHRLTSTVSYLHKNDIVHRDIKLDNILLSQDPEHPEDHLNIKLSDFGLSILKGRAGSDSMMQTMCGTPMYMAPEVIDNQGYSQQCDVWSIGVIAYMLLSGYPPFTGRDEDGLYEEIRRGELDFSGAVWRKVSDEAKNAIQGLLTVDPAHRLTASELLHHPWITGEKGSDNDGPKNVLEMMKQWKDELMLEENGQVDSNANLTGEGEGETEEGRMGGEAHPKEESEKPSDDTSCSKSAGDKSTLSSRKAPTASKSNTSRNSSNNGAHRTRGTASTTPSGPASKATPPRSRTAGQPPSQSRASPHRPSEVTANRAAAAKPRSPKAAAITAKSKRKPPVGS